MKGFTLIELVVVVALVVLFVGLAIPALRVAQKGSELEDTAELLVAVLRLAQNRTLGSEGASQYGVFFDTSTSPDRYILFKGSSYAARDVAVDEVNTLPASVEIAGTTLPGTETVFQKVSGTASGAGSITLRLVLNPEKAEEVYISTSGAIQRTNAFMPSDAERQKDSRHVHQDYTRTINTTLEIITLTFTPPLPGVPVVQTIPIVSNMQQGQIFWSGEVTVQGQVQKVTVQTHRLNDAVLGTQWSIRRDRRFNTVALSISLSGDLTGNLISYDANSQTTKGSSYASPPLWQ